MCTQQKIALWVCLISVILLTTFAQAQNYPNRPVTLVIPMFAGAAMDGAGRVLAEKLGEVLKTSVAVVNKPGASTVLGADFVVKSKNDGYTILLGNTSIVYAKVASPNIVPYDPFKDLEPLGLYCFFPFALAVRHDSPWKTFNDLVEYSKKNPKKIRISSPGELTLAHFNLEITQYVTGYSIHPHSA